MGQVTPCGVSWYIDKKTFSEGDARGFQFLLGRRKNTLLTITELVDRYKYFIWRWGLVAAFCHRWRRDRLKKIRKNSTLWQLAPLSPTVKALTYIIKIKTVSQKSNLNKSFQLNYIMASRDDEQINLLWLADLSLQGWRRLLCRKFFIE